MKKLLLLSTAILFISCSKKDLKQEQIEAKISENAMGNDLKYEPIATKEISQVTYQDILDSYFKELEITPEPIEEAINRTNFVIDKMLNHKDKSILNNIPHPICYFLVKMNKQTPVLLELFLKNGLNVHSQLLYNNKNKLNLLVPHFFKN